MHLCNWGGSLDSHKCPGKGNGKVWVLPSLEKCPGWVDYKGQIPQRSLDLCNFFLLSMLLLLKIVFVTC